MKAKSLSRNSLTGYIFMIPATVMMLIFVIYPLLSSFSYALYDWKKLGQRSFIGLANFAELLTADKLFWSSLRLTFTWVALSVVILSVSGLLMALLVEYGTRSRKLIPVARVVLFMPMIMSLVSVGILWALIFNPNMGLLNSLLMALGITSPMNPLDLLGDYDRAIFTVFIPVIWQWTGFGMVVYSAAIQGIPEDVLEAAYIDGADRWQSLKFIVMPLLKPTILLVGTVHLIGGFKCFDIIYVMTAGGPAESTLVTSIYMFRTAFVNQNYGYGSAISVALFVVTAFFGFIFMRFTSRTERLI